MSMLLKTRQLIALLFITITLPAWAQDDMCSAFYNFEEGRTMVYTSYDKKDKEEGQMINKVLEVQELDDGVMAVVSSTLKDKKGKEQMTGEHEVYCKNNTLMMDVSGIMNPAMQNAFAGMEVTIEGTALEVPEKLEVGMELPDASTNIRAGSGGISIINMTVNITDRKVEGMETITTDAGTFDCYRLTQTTEVQLMGKRSFKSVDYFAEGIGMVRSESYDRKGRLDSYMELTSMEQ